MTSPKPSRHLMSSPPVSSSARFRSPGIIRRNIMGDPGFQSAQIAKKSRRSKSSEANSRDVSSNLLSGKRKLSKPNEGGVEDHLEALNNRWRLMAKNQEKMTKEEIMNNYKLLLTDHIKLEKFMSLISRENELTRTRLESDLLDSMMLVEDLKQSLEARNVNRRSRIDPRDSAERRELIKQNKKLLNELHEAGKKNEKLELIIFDLKEQLELADFQMMEVQNQKIMMEEQLEVRGNSNSVSCQTTGVSAEQKVEILNTEIESMRNNYDIVKGDYNQLVADMQSIQDENDVLKISEENLQEELVIKTTEIKALMKEIEVLEDRIKNSMDDTPPSVEHVHVNGPRSMDDETILCNSDDFDELSNATDSGFDVSDIVIPGDRSSSLLGDTVKILWSMIKDKDEEIMALRNDLKGFDETPTMYKSLHDELEDATRLSTNPYNHHQSCKVNEKQIAGDKHGRQSPIGACCSSLYKLQLSEKENRRWKTFVENIGKSENELLHVIADLEETVRNHKQEAAIKADNKCNMSPQKSMTTSHTANRSAEYFSRRFEEIQVNHNEDQMSALLTDAEHARDDAKRQLLRLEDELEASNLYVEKLDMELTTAKKIELTLRRRIETLEQRVMTTHAGSGSGPTKSTLELETKISQLESVNSSLIEVNSLEKRRMEEQRAKINELEHAKKLLSEKLNNVQTKELFAQNKISRLQGVYEDLLREYAAMRTVPSNDRYKDQNNVLATTAHDDNKLLRAQLKELKVKYEELQTIIIRYQRHLFADGKVPISKLSNTLTTKSFNCQLRDYGSKINELTKQTK